MDILEIKEACYMYLLEKNIIRLRDGNCYGCQNNRPGQNDHMQGGCLCEWEETVYQYLTDAVNGFNVLLYADVVR